jgi:L-asparagine transporter-like permease
MMFGKTGLRPSVHPFNPIQKRDSSGGELSANQLVFVGVGGIIGAGFFLGAGMPIHLAGPSVLFAFIIGAVITGQVVGAISSVSVSHPVSGSFKAHADMFIGPFAGYMQGWIYYLASILTISSEATAMAVFVRVFIPQIPTLVSTIVFAAIILLLNAFGVKNFNQIESLMSIVKIAALVGFIVFAAVMLFQPASRGGLALFSSGGSLFPHGFSGLMQSMLIVIFSYAGIGVFASAASEIKQPKKLDFSAIMTMVILAGLYLLSVGLLLSMEPWQTMGTKSSPFVDALQHTGIVWLAYVLNAVILVASFSVMIGAVFSANQILFNMGESDEAPNFVTRVSKKGVQYGALIATTVCIAVSIGISNLLPANVYNFLISASSFFTFFTWILILWTFLRWKRRDEQNRHISRLTFGQPVSTILTMVAILVLTVYALMERDQRIGFYASVFFGLCVACSYLFVKRHKREKAQVRQE